MSTKIDIEHVQGDFTLGVKIETGGGVTGVFGPSGSGKTTLIRAIAGLNSPNRGQIIVDERVLFDADKGINLPPHQRKVGYVFQEPRLFPHLNVRDNLNYAMPRPLHSEPSLESAFGFLGISDLLDRRPKDLSGGEAQRVAIARALRSKPDILVMDEPLSALDYRRKSNILPYLQKLRSEARIPIFYVSHAMEEVAQLADDLLILRNGEVARFGPLGDILADPEAVSDIGVREAGALLTMEVLRSDAGDGLSELKASAGSVFVPQVGQAEGVKLKVRIKASDVILAKDYPDRLSALNVLPCAIVAVHEGQGPGVALALASGDDRLIARITRRSARQLDLKPGGRCFAVIKTVSVAPMDLGGADIPRT